MPLKDAILLATMPAIVFAFVLGYSLAQVLN